MNSVKFEIAAVLAVAFVLLLPYSISATNYTVGGNSQWNTGVNYTAWVAGKQFAVGDNLIFIYGSSHSVLEVSNSAYDSCTTSNPIGSETGGRTTVALNTTGGKWFICGTPGHCGQGMKLALNVSTGTATPGSPTSPPPPGATTGSPPPPPGNTSGTPPPPSSVAGALYVRMMDVVVAFTLCIVVVWLV